MEINTLFLAFGYFFTTPIMELAGVAFVLALVLVFLYNVSK
jgi:uncharacterized protein (DUF58 family)